MVFNRIALIILIGRIVSFSCKNEVGDSVEYWIINKLPEGIKYIYYDNTLSKPYLSHNSLNFTSDGALSLTTIQLWSEKMKSYAIWNDEITTNMTYDFSFGHSKGYYGFDENGNGFFIIHSIPLYPVGPSLSKKYKGLGSNAWSYGQNLMCISTSAQNIDSLIKFYLYVNPRLAEYVFPDNIQEIYKSLNNLFNTPQPNHLSTNDVCYSNDLNISDKLSLTIFAKTSNWNYDIYSDCISPNFKSDILAETWIKGNESGPICDEYKTLDIEKLIFNGIGIKLSEKNDHSKWSILPSVKIICVGDMNRMTTQYIRGGVMMCFSDNNFYNFLNYSIIKTSNCS